MTNISEIERLIETQLKRCDEYQGKNSFKGLNKTCLWTNENVAGVFNENFEGKEKALCVAGSGDQAFNLISKGVLEIDTFDINKLTEYLVLGLKRSMILKYSYKDFINVINIFRNNDTSNEEIYAIINGLFPYMDKEYQDFWNIVINSFHKINSVYNSKINLITAIFINFAGVTDVFKNNYYLHSEDNYNLLRSNLQKANITFHLVDATTIASEFSKKYDLIVLSNILDYVDDFWGYLWNYEMLRRYEFGLQRILSDDAIIFLHYIFNYKKGECFKKMLIQGSKVNESDLSSYEIRCIPKNFDLDYQDGIILKRVKK